ncbi:hypothetical protein JCM10207_008507 [Rhodosporidiobolus poonsookiae]
MRHGLRTAKLGRPTAHRVLMLRNLVSSLIEHQQITTTLPKAKAAQKLADQLIQWGKDGGKSNWDRANALLLNPKSTLRPLFSTLATRYASRPGGYTRIQRAGFRVGDRAPLAVLELVDNANDLRFENAARTVGREMAVRAREGAGRDAWWAWRKEVEAHGADEIGQRVGTSEVLDPLTRDNVVKALRFRAAPVPVDAGAALSSPSAAESVPGSETDAPSLAGAAASTPAVHPATLFLDRAYHHYLLSLAAFQLSTAPAADPQRTVQQLTQRLGPTALEAKGAPARVVTLPSTGRRERAGERTDGWEKVEGVEASRKGGPISRAKGSKGRESRARGAKSAQSVEHELARALEEVRL